MPDGRFLSRSIAVNKQLRAVSLEADFLFTRTIPHLDRDGRIDGDPDVIRATVCPMRKEMTADVIEHSLNELVRVRLVVRYEVEGQEVVWFPGFPNHQRGMKYQREQSSRLPAPPSANTRSHQTEPEEEGGPDELRTNSGSGPDQVLLSEVKLSELNGSEDNNNITSERERFSTDLSTVRTLLPENYRSELDRLFQRIPKASQTSWLCEIQELPNGMHGKPLTWAEIGSRLRDYNANGETLNLSRFRGYMRREAPKIVPGESSSNGKSGARGRSLVEAAKLYDKVRGGRSPEFFASLRHGFWDTLSSVEQSTIDAVGGISAILSKDLDAKNERILKAQMASILEAG